MIQTFCYPYTLTNEHTTGFQKDHTEQSRIKTLDRIIETRTCIWFDILSHFLLCNACKLHIN